MFLAEDFEGFIFGCGGEGKIDEVLLGAFPDHLVTEPVFAVIVGIFPGAVGVDGSFFAGFRVFFADVGDPLGGFDGLAVGGANGVFDGVGGIGALGAAGFIDDNGHISPAMERVLNAAL